MSDTPPSRHARRTLILGGGTALTVGLAFWTGKAPVATTHDDDPTAVARRRRALRATQFTWVPFEAGAPSVDSLMPFGSKTPFADLAPIAGTSDEGILRQLYAATMDALPGFVAAAAPRLKPGRYGLEAVDAAHMRETAARLAALGWPRLPAGFGVGADGGFMYTAEHAAILPRLRWTSSRDRDAERLRPDEIAADRDADTGETSWPVLAVEPKRPYGNMTYAEADMAETLGIAVGQDAQGYATLPRETATRLAALHGTTPAALRVLVLHGAERT